jgi:methylated-DNA-[protein]-cysteine S-methyltransferase
MMEYVSPIGTLFLAAQDGFITELKFSASAMVQTANPDPQSEAVLALCAKQLDEYFAGKRREFSVKVRATGTPFRELCWEQLQKIPYGETISYKELAKRIGKPAAVRAVGGANHNNPIAIIIPCHRVIGADGSLTGFGGGLEVKKFLLELEKGGE